MTLGNNAIRRFREAGAITSRVADATLGLDIVQGTGESEPTAMVYVSDPPPSPFWRWRRGTRLYSPRCGVR